MASPALRVRPGEIVHTQAVVPELFKPEPQGWLEGIFGGHLQMGLWSLPHTSCNPCGLPSLIAFPYSIVACCSQEV